nr:spore germination protein GerPE [Bacillus benzoevorans]
MQRRLSKVDSLHINSAILASVIQIGDSSFINSFSRAIAVHRQKELFFTNEEDFRMHGIFSYSLPLPPIDESISMQFTSLNPIIKVGSIDVTAMSASPVLHIGSSEHIQAEARILHIRQFETAPKTRLTEGRNK